MSLPESISIIRKELHVFFDKKISIPSILREPINYVYTLSPQHAPGQTIDSKNNIHNIWSFPVKKELSKILDRYPIYFSITIKLQPDEEIEELNIKLFKEDTQQKQEGNIIPTELLLRVEWSNLEPAKDAKYVHAQPHWHVHSTKFVDGLEGLPAKDRSIFKDFLNESQSNSATSLMSELQEEEVNVINVIQEQTKLNEKKDVHGFKFHLAMLADWHMNLDTQVNTTLTNKMLEKWLPQCLKYIKSQVEHLLERM